MKITKNFSFYEFGPKGCDKEWVPDNDYQKMLIKNLAENLQILIDKSPVKLSIIVTNGIRSLEDYYRLKKEGYNPSGTSDHFCGTSIPVDPGNGYYKKFGSMYNFSTGAADCIAKGMSQTDFFKHAMKCYRECGARFGQIIHEVDPVKKAEWVHFSGQYETYFSDRIVTWLDKKRFLESLDGGKTYSLALA